jgi:hypothetical protein
MLRLEARFSHQKRMAKIAAVFPRTFELLGAGLDAVERAFVAACPPQDISRMANAHQFHDFLLARWRRRPPVPVYLPDVAACELACARLRLAAQESGEPADAAGPAGPAGRGARRRRNVMLLRCAFDVRAIFEGAIEKAAPVARDTHVAIAPDPRSAEPQMIEVAPEVFDLLCALDQWTDPAALEGSPEAIALIAELAAAGLLEVRR